MLIVFSDIDGTLADAESFSFEVALPALELLRQRDVPLVLTSSKPFAEMRRYQRELGIEGPFIAENGAAIYVPTGYFDFAVEGADEEDGFSVVALGRPIAEVRTALPQIAAEADARLRGSGEMEVEEFARRSALPADLAALEMERRFDEPFVLLEGDIRRVEQAANAHALRVVRGNRFWHLSARCDKGLAARRLASLFRRRFPHLSTAALGDSANDLPLLEAVDRGMLVQRPDGSYAETPSPRAVNCIEGIGPIGWRRAIETLLGNDTPPFEVENGDGPLTTLEVSRRLRRAYGDPPWRASQDPLSQLVATILSQNTSDANSGRAFRQLRAAFGGWREVARADVDAVERAIRNGGLSRIKAARIQQALAAIEDERETLDIGFLAEMPLEEAKAWLRRLPGVGPKTAGCVLLFSLGRPVLPVDTHMHRVTRRLGLIGERVGAEAAHELLEAQLPPEEVYAFHVNLVELGRRTCRAARPRCEECPIGPPCPSYTLPG